MRTCHNCGELVPVANYLMHESHCYRHLTKCSTCKKVLLQSEATEHKHCDFCGQGLQLCELKKHLQLAHTPLACSCGYVAEWTAMLDHTSKTCPKSVQKINSFCILNYLKFGVFILPKGIIVIEKNIFSSGSKSTSS